MKSFRWVLGGVVLLAGSAGAAALPAGVKPPDALRPAHPRIFFNAETWPTATA